MFTNKVQGFYIEENGWEPLPFLYNSIQNYHFGRKVVGYLLDGSLCQVEDSEPNSFYPLTESNVYLYREIWNIHKEIDSILVQIEKNSHKDFIENIKNRHIYSLIPYLVKQKEWFISEIKNKNYLIFFENNFHLIKEQNTANKSRKNDFIIECLYGVNKGKRITISMIDNYYLSVKSIAKFMNYRDKNREFNNNQFKLKSEINSLQTKIHSLSRQFSFEDEDGVSIDVARTFEPMLINDFLGEELISEELADLEQFKSLLTSVLPRSENMNRISVHNFFLMLRNRNINSERLFIKNYDTIGRKQLDVVPRRLTIGLTKDAATFCSFDALCECIIHNEALFKRVLDFIELKK